MPDQLARKRLQPSAPPIRPPPFPPIAPRKFLPASPPPHPVSADGAPVDWRAGSTRGSSVASPRRRPPAPVGPVRLVLQRVDARTALSDTPLQSGSIPPT